MYARRTIIAYAVTIMLMAYSCHGMPTTPDMNSSPYSFYYKVYDKETNNYQGHVERTDSSGTKRGTYYQLSPDGIWYETLYIADGSGFRSETRKLTNPDQLSVNAFGPEEKIRSDEGQIIIADGAGVIGGTIFGSADDSDEPIITTRIRPGGNQITEDDIRTSLFGETPANRPIIFGPFPVDTRPQPPRREPSREIIFGPPARNDIPSEDFSPSAPGASRPTASLPADNFENSFDSGFDSFDSGFDSFDTLSPDPVFGQPSVDANEVPGILSSSFDSLSGQPSPSFDSFPEQPSPSFDSFPEQPSPSFDTFQGGQPSFDTFQGGQPSFDTFQGGQPSFDTFQGGQPAFDTFQGQPSFDTVPRQPSSSFDRIPGQPSTNFDVINEPAPTAREDTGSESDFNAGFDQLFGR